MTINPKNMILMAAGSAAALTITIAGLLLTSRPAQATAQFAAQTGLACGACHTDPKGAGPLTAVGEKFKANGNKMPK